MEVFAAHPDPDSRHSLDESEVPSRMAGKGGGRRRVKSGGGNEGGRGRPSVQSGGRTVPPVTSSNVGATLDSNLFVGSADPSIGKRKALYLNDFGVYCLSIGDLERARSSFEEALEVLENLRADGGVRSFLARVRALRRSTTTWVERSEFRSHIDGALAAAPEVDDGLDVGDIAGAVLGNLGHTFRALGDLKQAESYYVRAATYLDLSPHPYLPLVLGSLALVHLDRGNYEQSERFLDRAAAIGSRETGTKAHRAWLQTALSLLHRSRGEATRALATAEEAIATLGELRECQDQRPSAELLSIRADAFWAMGLALRDLDRNEEALSAVSEAESLLHQITDHHPRLARILSTHGLLLYDLGADAAAMDQFEMAQAVLQGRGINDLVTEAALHNNRANVLKRQGSIEAATEFYNEALNLLAEVNPLHPNIGRIHHNLSLLDRERGRVDEAVVESERAIALLQSRLPLHPDVARMELQLGRLLSERGELVLAEERFRSALARLGATEENRILRDEILDAWELLRTSGGRDGHGEFREALLGEPYGLTMAEVADPPPAQISSLEVVEG